MPSVSSRGPTRRVATALLAACATFGAARAGERTCELDGVRVSISSSWPRQLNQGWQPLWVRVESTRDTEARLQITLRNNGPSSDTIVRDVELMPLGFERFEIAAPVRANAANSYLASFEVDGASGHLGVVGSEQSCPDENRIVLVASRTATTVDAARWAAALSKEAEPRVPCGSRSRSAGATSPISTVDNVIVGVVRHEELSSLPEAYSSLDALVLDASSGTPPQRELDTILAWARAGGVVAVLGRGADDFVARVAPLAAWCEPRFLSSATGTARAYLLGLGVLVVSESETLLADADQLAALNRAVEVVAPLDGPAPRSRFQLWVPGLELPIRPLAGLLVLFAVLVGPVNLILVRKSRRPALLLVTIPALTLCFSVAIVGYGVAAQGLDVRVASQTRGVLDQRSHHGTLHERRVTFAGLASADGLRPGGGAVVQRVMDSQPGGTPLDYRTEYGDARQLTGAWMPVRTAVRHYVTTDRAERARVELRRGPDGWRATNALGVPIARLLFRDADGDLHVFAGPIADGLGASAEPLVDDALDVKAFEIAQGVAVRVEDGGFLPRGAWIARVSASPMVDACGLEYEEVQADHMILGVIDMAEAR